DVQFPIEVLCGLGVAGDRDGAALGHGAPPRFTAAHLAQRPLPSSGPSCETRVGPRRFAAGLGALIQSFAARFAARRSAATSARALRSSAWVEDRKARLITTPSSVARS